MDAVTTENYHNNDGYKIDDIEWFKEYDFLFQQVRVSLTVFPSFIWGIARTQAVRLYRDHFLFWVGPDDEINTHLTCANDGFTQTYHLTYN